MRRLRGLALAAVLLGLAPSVASATGASGTEILQFAKHPGPRAAQTGRALAGSLRELGIEARGFSVLPMIVVSGTRAELAVARALPGVLYAHPASRLRFLLDKSVPLVYDGPPQPVRDANGGGRGVRVAIVDTGIDGLHPDLGSRVVENVRFLTDTETEGTNGQPNGLGLPAAQVAVTCPAACNTDDSGHGTNVAGIVAGPGRPDGLLAGMTPEAELVGLAIDSQNPLDWYALAAFDHVLAHPELGIRVVNNSWSQEVNGRFDPTNAINQGTRMLHDAGIAVVFAAGNGGQGNPAPGQPAGSSNCIDGGATDCAISMYGSAPWTIMVAGGYLIPDGSRAEDQMLYALSSRGDPRPDRVGGIDVRYEPTLTAPAEDIMTTAAATSPIKCAGICRHNDQPLYTSGSGTSFAAPHVSGAIALLQTAARARLGRFLTADEVKAVLVEGATPMVRPFSESSTCGLIAQAAGMCPPQTPGTAFASWQVGAGYLSVPGALRAIDRLG